MGSAATLNKHLPVRCYGTRGNIEAFLADVRPLTCTVWYREQIKTWNSAEIQLFFYLAKHSERSSIGQSERRFSK